MEHRYSQLRSDVYTKLLERYGHTRLGPKQYTASAFIAKTLGSLADRGEILYREGPATGYWKYNSAISYWALPPEIQDDRPLLSYEEFAVSEGLDPMA